MKSWFKKGQKGFTLVELMVVMGILGVLAAIVVPAVSGTTEVSTDAQVKTDAGMVQSAIGEYYGDRTGAEVFTTDTSTILTTTAISQVKSTRWPETYLQTGYATEFPELAASGTQNVTAVNVKDIAGATISLTALAAGYNAIDLDGLATDNYIPEVVASADEMSDSYHNYIWLVKKTEASSGSDKTVESRSVVVLKLAKVETNETTGYDTLTYEQIY